MLYPRHSALTVQQSKRACLHTHGCRLNQAETEVIRQQLQQAGYQIVSFGDPTDLAILNTCTVTREAEAKCRQSIRKVIRYNPQAFIAVIGCYSQTGASAIAAIKGVDLIVGNQDKLSVLDYVHYGKNERPVILREQIDRKDFSIRFVGDLPTDQRANLKIQDGCDFMCAFCIIPFARGRARSRNFDNLLSEAHTLAGNGVQELVLTGVNIGTFYSQGHDFLSLVDALNQVPGLHRLRISSIEPTTIPVDLFARMRDPGHSLLPYLHIPLQSGTDKVLQLMRRRYSTSEYLDFIARAESEVPDLCIGTDIMVGHPGESEADFEETCRVFLDNPFAYCHVFPYSERPGTLSMRRSESIPVSERQRRSTYLRRLSAEKRYHYYTRFLGKTMEVLFEHQREGIGFGYTANFIRVACPSDDPLINRRVQVRLERLSADFVEGSKKDRFPKVCLQI